MMVMIQKKKMKVFIIIFVFLCMIFFYIFNLLDIFRNIHWDFWNKILMNCILIRLFLEESFLWYFLKDLSFSFLEMFFCSFIRGSLFFYIDFLLFLCLLVIWINQSLHFFLILLFSWYLGLGNFWASSLRWSMELHAKHFFFLLYLFLLFK